jgi:hypothetical protein
MIDDTLAGLLHAFIDGDVIARKALLDWLEERGDPRVEDVSREAIDWWLVAWDLVRPGAEQRVPLSYGGYYPSADRDVNRTRWYIDCVRAGSDAPPDVVRAVREARRKWLAGLFPEMDLGPGGS